MILGYVRTEGALALEFTASRLELKIIRNLQNSSKLFKLGVAVTFIRLI